MTRARAAVERVGGVTSPYGLQIQEILTLRTFHGMKASMIVGVRDFIMRHPA